MQHWLGSSSIRRHLYMGMPARQSYGAPLVSLITWSLLLSMYVDMDGWGWVSGILDSWQHLIVPMLWSDFEFMQLTSPNDLMGFSSELELVVAPFRCTSTSSHIPSGILSTFPNNISQQRAEYEYGWSSYAKWCSILDSKSPCCNLLAPPSASQAYPSAPTQDPRFGTSRSMGQVHQMLLASHHCHATVMAGTTSFSSFALKKCSCLHEPTKPAKRN